jgi:hypothetical protein
MNRIECQFTALREFTLNGTDHATHREQGSMIRRYIAWRNRHTATPPTPACAALSSAPAQPETAAHGSADARRRDLAAELR